MEHQKYLEAMLRSAEKRNQRLFTRLNQTFDRLFKPMTHNAYDLFRQSCNMCFSMPELYTEAISDARQRYRQL